MSDAGIRVNDGFLERYLPHVPVPLALERSVECGILAAQQMKRPILDLGCGDGFFAHVLFAEPIDAGLDPDTSELEIARRHGIYEELIAAGGDSIPRPDGAFASVFANSVLEHIPELEPVLHEVNRVLASDGRFYVTIPTHRFEELTIGNVVLTRVGARRLATRWRAFFKRFWNLYNVNHPDIWVEMFARAGFEVEDSFEYEPPSLYLLKEALMPFSLPGAISKRISNRWVILPPLLRRLVTRPVVWLSAATRSRWARADRGCLIFMRLRKAAG
jgi:SAM-dependent methyltransferase